MDLGNTSADAAQRRLLTELSKALRAKEQIAHGFRDWLTNCANLVHWSKRWHKDYIASRFTCTQSIFQLDSILFPGSKTTTKVAQLAMLAASNQTLATFTSLAQSTMSCYAEHGNNNAHAAPSSLARRQNFTKPSVASMCILSRTLYTYRHGNNRTCNCYCGILSEVAKLAIPIVVAI